MDVLIREANKVFTRTSAVIDKSIVFHCVPGSGKSTFIRGLLRLDNRFECRTLGAPDSVNLSCRLIKRFDPTEVFDPKKFYLLDEYTAYPGVPEGFVALFGDPVQINQSVSEPHFTSSVTRRFGRATCELLQSFGFDISSEKEDKVRIGSVFTEDPVGEVIAVGPAVTKALCNHGLIPHCVEDIRGSTFARVTVYLEESCIKDKNRAEVFVALTRHREELLILTPDAAFCPS